MAENEEMTSNRSKRIQNDQKKMPDVPNRIQNVMKIHVKSNQNPSKSIQNPSLERGPEKTRKKFEKVMLRIPPRLIDFGPKVVQNDIQKSSKNRYRKSMPK